jgi:hypothetical protein
MSGVIVYEGDPIAIAREAGMSDLVYVSVDKL